MLVKTSNFISKIAMLNNLYFSLRTALLLTFFILFAEFANSQNKLTTYLEKVEDKKIYFEAFADGNIMGALNGSGEDNSGETIQSGSIGLAVKTDKGQWIGSINIADTGEDIISDVSNVILNPESGKSGKSGYLSFTFYDRFKILNFEEEADLSLYGSISGGNWGTAEVNESAVVLGLGALLMWDQVRTEFDENIFRMRFGFGPSLRRIFGDITSNDTLLTELTGSAKKTYIGVEARFQIMFSSVTSTLKFNYYLPDGNHSPGISDGQLSGHISISAPLFKGSSKQFIDR